MTRLGDWWRARNEPPEFPDEWRRVLETCLAPWGALSADERERLEQLALQLIVNKRWEATAGLTIPAGALGAATEIRITELSPANVPAFLWA